MNLVVFKQGFNLACWGLTVEARAMVDQGKRDVIFAIPRCYYAPNVALVAPV